MLVYQRVDPGSSQFEWQLIPLFNGRVYVIEGMGSVILWQPHATSASQPNNEFSKDLRQVLGHSYGRREQHKCKSTPAFGEQMQKAATWCPIVGQICL